MSIKAPKARLIRASKADLGLLWRTNSRERLCFASGERPLRDYRTIVSKESSAGRTLGFEEGGKLFLERVREKAWRFDRGPRQNLWTLFQPFFLFSDESFALSYALRGKHLDSDLFLKGDTVELARGCLIAISKIEFRFNRPNRAIKFISTRCRWMHYIFLSCFVFFHFFLLSSFFLYNFSILSEAKSLSLFLIFVRCRRERRVG